MAGEVALMNSLSKPNVPVTGQPQMVYVLLEVMPTEVMAQVTMPLNFTLVLDCSSSMKGEKIKRLQDAVQIVIDMLNPQDIISIVRFDATTKVIMASQRVGGDAERQTLRNKLRALTPSVGTVMAPGMQAGLAEVAKGIGPNRVTRMVVLTDGQTKAADECRALAEEAGRLGVPIVALGIGADWNEKLLHDIAQRSGGQAEYIAKPQQIAPYFQTAVQAMQGAVIQNAVLTLHLAAGVAPRKLWRVAPIIADLGYKYLSDRDVTVPLGELEKDQGQGLLVELMLPARPAGQYRIAQADLSYDVPLLGILQERVRSDVMLGFTSDAELARQVSPRVMNILEKVTAFKLQTRALEEAEVGNIAGATQKLRAAATILLNQGETELARTAQSEADQLEQQGQMSAEGRKTIRFQGGKTVRLNDQPGGGA